MNAINRHPANTTFRPAVPPVVVRDNTLNGVPVLLLGWWIGTDGTVAGVQVGTFSHFRAAGDIAGFHGEPVAPPPSEAAAPELPPHGGWYPEEER